VEGTAEFKTEPLKFGECRMFTAGRARLGFFAILTQRVVRLSEPLGRYFRQKSTDFHNDRASEARPLFCPCPTFKVSHGRLGPLALAAG
jgi:hypothetical protein